MLIVEKVRVAIVGVGLAGRFHYDAYATIPQAEVVAVASRHLERAQAFASERGIPDAYDDYRRLLERTDIDMIDVCTPNYVHKDICIEAAQAGKHIVCEKPLTGYFGEDMPEDVELVGNVVSKSEMFKKALANAQAIADAVQRNNVQFTYAENWVYAPPIQKARRLLEASKGVVMFIRAEESHSGSASPFSMQWRTCGGGALLRLGSHPIGAVLYLKQAEGMFNRGQPIRPTAVYAQVADLTQMDAFQNEPQHFLVTGWKDVENWSMAVIDFDDGSKAVIFANDCCLGGIYDRMEIYASNCRIQINMNPNDTCVAYAPTAEIFADEYIAEKLETKAGWTFPSVNEDFLRGYPQELQDAVQAALDANHKPLSSIQLAVDVVKVIYAGYMSAEKGRRVELA
ncbi:MAG TPA: Gfo/Idh/MocA family oxidoreductase [Armatimonadetes bacterium]|nr:Gfo/Idh/MocA family oxidoreductase [Armatimonadota bacterium]